MVIVCHTLDKLDEQIYRRLRAALLDRRRSESMLMALVRAEHGWPIAALGAMIADRDRRWDWPRANFAVAAA